MEDGTDSPDTPAAAVGLPPNPLRVPPMPATPYKRNVVFGGDKHSLLYSKDRAGDRFLLTEGASTRKVVDTYPLTVVGWERAWRAFARLEPVAAEKSYQAQQESPRGEWRKAVAQSLGAMPDSTYLGGHGLPLVPGALYFLLFDDEGLTVAEKYGESLAKVSFAEIETMEISGRGELKSGGGVLGGGFGLAGAVTGMAIAALLNSATTRTHMETVVQLEMAEGEAFFHYGLAAPERLRIELSAVFGRLRRRSSTDQVGQSQALMTEQLGKLADLRREGLLSEEEFAVAKQRLLSE